MLPMRGIGLQDLLNFSRSFQKDFSPWLAHVVELKKNHPLDYDRECDFIQPHYVLECLNKITQGEAIICTGVGQHQMWAAQYLDYKHSRSFLTSGSMGTMGFGLPGSHRRCSLPGRTVWSSILMVMVASA